MYDRDYTDLHTIYPTEGLESKTYKIKQSILTETQISMDKTRGMLNGNYWMFAGLKPDFPYITLIKKGEGAMMSDTPMERTTNQDFIDKANGDVLIFGLGLGLVIMPLLKDKAVKSITVIELYQDLIDMVKPILKEQDVDNKLTIVQGDCFEYHKEIPKGQLYDCIYGDIWLEISSDNWDEMKDLTRKYTSKKRQKRFNPDSFITHWVKDRVQAMATKARREEREWAWLR